VAKILVADDNSNIQKMVILALKDQGIEVVAVGNGEAAVRKISDLKPDLVLADIFMPVRNGYEVCKYVKDDPKLSHIPVILLVGAFDPLDEQEAQRVGADGVLKKPFVPPDPLISMVKSALARAGVALGTPAVATPPPPMPVAKKPEPVPSPTPKIVPPPRAFSVSAEEEFPSPAAVASKPNPFQFDKGAQPLAFGSLLDTGTQDDEALFALSPKTQVAPDRDWGSASAVDEEEETEEDSKHNSWRVSSLPEAAEETPAGQADWREAAFSGVGSGLDTGTGAEKSHHAEWAPSIERLSLSISEEEAAMQAREREKFASIAAPHGQEDWAKAIREVLPETPVVTHDVRVLVAADAPVVVETALPVTPIPVTPAPIPAPVFASEPEQLPSKPDVNSWMAGAVSPWEAELQRASQLTATWQSANLTPAPAALVDEALVGDASAHETLAGETSATNAFLNSGLMSAPRESHYEDALAQDHPAEEPEEEEPVEESSEPVIAEQALAGDFVFAQEPVVFAQKPVVFGEEVVAGESHVESVPAIESLLTEETQEILHEQAAQVLAKEPPAVIEKLDTALAASSERMPAAASVPDMDEIVAKVLARMNPEVLQAVTREILKPLVEAMIKDEIHKK
jgi:CheY-like chemotaxis protein